MADYGGEPSWQTQLNQLLWQGGTMAANSYDDLTGALKRAMQMQNYDDDELWAGVLFGALLTYAVFHTKAVESIGGASTQILSSLIEATGEAVPT